MQNLAGNKDADKFILEELYLAEIPKFKEPGKGEVPYSYIGKIGKWTFKRLWYYWSVRVEDGVAGMPLDLALELHSKKDPTDEGSTLGEAIRPGGHAGSISPDDYVSQPLDDEDFIAECKSLGIELRTMKSLGLGDDDVKQYPQLNYGEIATLCKEGKMKSPRYVNLYHIDTLVGLKEFVNFIKTKPCEHLIVDETK